MIMRPMLTCLLAYVHVTKNVNIKIILTKNLS